MRVEATVPDARAMALDEMAVELGVSRSQIIDEALSLFLKAVLEVRQGRRVVSMGPAGSLSTTEIVTPTLAQLEWTAHRQALALSAAAVKKVAALASRPAKPNANLRKLMASRP
jgi:DNA-binding FadR family transcriptional regulator